MKIKGRFIKMLREALGLTLDQVATLIGYAKSTIWDIESNGNSRAEIELLARLAILYNIQIEDMIDMNEIYEDLKRIKMLNAKIPTIS